METTIESHNQLVSPALKFFTQHFKGTGLHGPLPTGLKLRRKRHGERIGCFANERCCNTTDCTDR